MKRNIIVLTLVMILTIIGEIIAFKANHIIIAVFYYFYNGRFLRFSQLLLLQL